MTSAGIHLASVTKRFGSFTALNALELAMPAGSFTVLVGPSGCGKSTALRMLAGLDRPDSGTIAIGGRDVTALPPGRRNLSMVFQDFALYPHMSVVDNIAFSLKLEAKHNRRNGPSRTEIGERVDRVCALLGLDGLHARRPAQLSGGQRQRVALARAIVRRPAVLLLDEPLSSLDAQLRQQARTELLRLHRDLTSTIVHVTHDQVEALSMATHLVVLNHGKVEQAGTPEQIYRTPANTFVATFLGSPAMNTHAVSLTGTGIQGPGVRGMIEGVAHSGPATLGWRPADAAVLSEVAAPASGVVVEGIIDVVEYTGDGQLLTCTGPAGRWAVSVAGTPRQQGDTVLVHIPPAGVHLFDSAGQRVAS